MAKDTDKTDAEIKEASKQLGTLGIGSSVLDEYLKWERTQPDSPEKRGRLEKLFRDYPGLEAILGNDLELADTFLMTEMPQGRQSGLVAAAPHPLEYLSAALRQGIGGYKRGQDMKELRQLSADKSEMIKKVGERAAAYQGEPAPVQPNIAQQAAGMGRGRMSDEYAAPMAQSQPVVGQQAAPAVQAALGAEVADERRDNLGDLAMLKAAALRSRAQQAQANNADIYQRRPQLDMMPAHNVDESGMRIPIRRGETTTIADILSSRQ